jgi:hypothetical protein
MMSKDDKTGQNEPFPPSLTAKTELAEQGWFVEVILTSDSQNETVFFAVGVNAASDAEVAVLRYPGIQPRDSRIAKRKLSSDEISHLNLWHGGVRPFGRTVREIHPRKAGGTKSVGSRIAKRLSGLFLSGLHSAMSLHGTFRTCRDA